VRGLVGLGARLQTFGCLNFHASLLKEFGVGSCPVGCIEHLARFKNHLDDMLIAVGLRGLDRVVVENEEIHWVATQKGVCGFKFCEPFWFSLKKVIHSPLPFQ